MTLIQRWDPFRDLEDFQARLSSAFGRQNGSLKPSSDSMSVTRADWVPLVDVEEDEKEFLFTVELPDLKKEDVKVKVDSGVLTISGERKIERDEQNKKYHRVERSYGAFARSFILPDDTDSEAISAEFKNGLLFVHLPKSEKARPKLIDVKIN